LASQAKRPVNNGWFLCVLCVQADILERRAAEKVFSNKRNGPKKPSTTVAEGENDDEDDEDDEETQQSQGGARRVGAKKAKTQHHRT